MAVFHPANNLPAIPTLEHMRRFPELSAFFYKVVRSSLQPRGRNRPFTPGIYLVKPFPSQMPRSSHVFLSVPLLMPLPGILPRLLKLSHMH